MKSSWIAGAGDFLDHVYQLWRQDRPNERVERIVIPQDENYEFDYRVFDALEPEQGEVFIAVDDRFGNFKRVELMREAVKRDLRLASFVHSRAMPGLDVAVGKGVFIGQGAVVEYGSRVGDGAVIHAGVHIGLRSTIGALCWLESGVQIGNAVKLGDHCSVRTGAMVAGGAEIGEQCELAWPQTYRGNVPARTIFDPRYDEPIHTYDFSRAPA